MFGIQKRFTVTVIHEEYKEKIFFWKVTAKKRKDIIEHAKTMGKSWDIFKEGMVVYPY